ncbi:MAG: TIR domain-containing protein [bacterium]|nr:TIR domain-containing protein [bacterium]
MANGATPEDLLYFNGVNGATGDYGLPAMTGEELSQFLQGEATPENFNELKERRRQDKLNQGKAEGEEHMGVKEGVDPKKLDEAGWGVVFAQDAEPAVREALEPLLRLREEQAGERFKVYEGRDGCRPGEAKGEFLARHGVGPGPADPEKVPYYLLLVGSPEAIPYRFQSQLDVQYAVGRIHFDTVGEYARYAESVVVAEQGGVRLPRQVSFFGVENAEDKATRLSSRNLVSPLREHMRAKQSDWDVSAFLKEEATKANLVRLLGGAETPALLFTASHGMEFPNGDSRQLPHQGALLCQDWPGPRAKGPISQDFYFAGDDLASDAGLAGLIAFCFACYGAGTPRHDEFAKQAFKDRAAIAPHAFLAALPTKMLSHPRGGALAVIGHVERAWGYSFQWNGAGAQTAVFESTFDRLLDGHPVGSALEYFDERYAELSTVLADQLGEIDAGVQADPYELAGMWTANNDARGYVVLGDPAVRLRVAEAGEKPKERPVIEVREKAIPIPTEECEDSAVDFVPGTEGDEVGFRAYLPRALPVGERRKLLVYAHLAAALAAVESDAGQVLGKEAKDYRRAEDQASTAIAPGTEITVVPQGEGLVFDPPQARITWSGDWQRADFEMAATGERVGHVIEGSIACYVGPLLIADLRLPVVVPGAGEEVAADDAEQDSQSARMYQAIFASYSHADTAVVEAMETACKALGMDYLRDVMTLKSGQQWSDELLHMVERADIFQLFWSATASQSPYVEQEWQHALKLAERKGAAFIRPIYWQKPLAPVPGNLSHLHFAPVELGGLVASAAAPVAVASPPPAVVAERVVGVVVPGDVEDLVTLTVSTYAAADPDDPATARLKARTRISLTGDVEVHLSEDTAEGHLEVHEKTVREALRARLAYLELLAR